MPANFAFQQIPADLRKTIQELMKARKLVLFIADQGKRYSDIPWEPLDALTQSERITERRVKRQLVKERRKCLPPYDAAASRQPTAGVTFLDDEKLVTEGFISDTIETTHEPLVTSIDTDWENATLFMVAIDQCKALAMPTTTSQTPYSPARQ